MIDVHRFMCTRGFQKRTKLKIFAFNPALYTLSSQLFFLFAPRDDKICELDISE